MKKILPLALLLAFAVGVCAQSSAIPTFDGENFSPYVFDAYKADYRIDFDFVNANLNLAGMRITVEELPEIWRETREFDYPSFNNSDEMTKHSVVTEIDVKTGLPLKETSLVEPQNPQKKGFKREERFFSKGNLVIAKTESDGKKTSEKKVSIPLKQVLYPCVSATFYSYLPLSDNFAGSFYCYVSNSYLDNNREALIVVKKTMQAAGTEFVSNAAGLFNCYKLKEKTEQIGYYDYQGNFHPDNKAINRAATAKYGVKDDSSSSFVDKKTRKLISASLTMRGWLGASMVIMPLRQKL